MSVHGIGRLLLLPLLLLAACERDGGDPIIIGVAGPLGAANGASMKLAAQMAVKEINDAGGIGGRMIELVEVDDGADPQRALDGAKQLALNENVVAVIGHVNSAASLRASDAYNGRLESVPPVLQISPASSSPQLTHAGEWTFRVTPTDHEFAPVLAQAAAQLGRRRAVVMYVNDDYGQGVRSTFEAAFRAAGGEVVSADPYLGALLERGDELDPYLARALRRGADALVIGGQADAGVKIIRAARRLGFTGPILGADGMTGAKDAGPIAEGVYVSSAFLPDRDTDVARRFVTAYRAAFDSDPDHRGAMTYDVVYLLKQAVEAVGTDRRALRDYMASRVNTGSPFEGVSGTIAFDENCDVVGKPVALGIVRGGELVSAAR
jgi:branched-chain amino acid transport system substrate-binding protein